MLPVFVPFYLVLQSKLKFKNHFAHFEIYMIMVNKILRLSLFIARYLKTDLAYIDKLKS